MRFTHSSGFIRLLPFIIIALLFSGCKAFNLRVAENYYDEYAYSRAIPKYEKVLRKEFISTAASRLADSYRKTGNSMKAEIWYRRLSKSPDVTLLDRRSFAEVLMENGKYSEAGEMFREYLKFDPTDKKAKKLTMVCDSVHLFFEDTTVFNISLAEFNGESESNFSPSFYRDGIVFVSDRSAPGKSKVTSPWTGKEYLDLFFTKKDNNQWSTPVLLKGDINGLYDEGPAVFSPGGTSVYFTRMDYTGKSVEKNQKDLSLLKLFHGTFTGSVWKLAGPMTFNSDEYSVGHPALSASGEVIYFVSDMPWGYGGTDIYKSEMKNGLWSEPVNLGPSVNTDGNEMFPFLAADSVLYFASDGHFGLGGLDVYSSYWNGEEWTKAENLQYPVNSSKDDFGFIIDTTNTAGFFSSNRDKNRDMIYGFRKNPPVFDYKLLAKDSKTGKPVKALTVYSLSRKGERQVLANGNDGLATASLTPNTEYKVEVKAKGYFSASSSFSTLGKRKSATIADSISLMKIDINKAVVWKGIHFPGKSAVLSTESSKVLDSLVLVMNMNPEIEIEIASHTDSRGAFTDNLSVTKKRAELMMEYIIGKGIKPARVMSIGYGEGKLINQCRDGIFCIEEDHMVNNRVEVKVTGLSAR